MCPYCRKTNWATASFRTGGCFKCSKISGTQRVRLNLSSKDFPTSQVHRRHFSLDASCLCKLPWSVWSLSTADQVVIPCARWWWSDLQMIIRDERMYSRPLGLYDHEWSLGVDPSSFIARGMASMHLGLMASRHQPWISSSSISMISCDNFSNLIVDGL